MSTDKPIIIITGPTATGKSRLAIEVCHRLGGEVVSCDSMQLYRGMDIGTAKVTPAEMQGVVHHMIDIVDADAQYSVACYQQDALRIIEDIMARGKVPVLVGGTGLYIDAVLYPMQFKQYDPTIRARIEQDYQRLGKQAMYDQLCALSPDMAAKLYPNDVKRVTRALELVYAGQAHNTEDLRDTPRNHLMVVLHDDRAALYDRINARVDDMVGAGLVAEVKGLLDSGVAPDCRSFQAIAYKELADYHLGNCSLDDAIDLIKKRSRNYAKRQLTWFRRYQDAVWLQAGDPHNADIIIERYLEKTQ